MADQDELTRALEEELGSLAVERARNYGDVTRIFQFMMLTHCYPVIEFDEETGRITNMERGKYISRESVYMGACRRVENKIPEEVLQKRLGVSEGVGVKRLEVHFILDAKPDDPRVTSGEMEELEGEFRLLGGGE